MAPRPRARSRVRCWSGVSFDCRPGPALGAGLVALVVFTFMELGRLVGMRVDPAAKTVAVGNF